MVYVMLATLWNRIEVVDRIKRGGITWVLHKTCGVVDLRSSDTLRRETECFNAQQYQIMGW